MARLVTGQEENSLKDLSKESKEVNKKLLERLIPMDDELGTWRAKDVFEETFKNDSLRLEEC